jgi:hypothetical protein
MKPEIKKNTPNDDIKAIFFAQYWNQDYLYKNQYGTFKSSMSDSNNLYNFNEHLRNNAVLLLKSISKMTDADYRKIPISERILKEQFIIWCNEIDVECKHIWADYLRKLGYLTDWMEYSSEDLISFGWVKIK